MSNEKPTHVYVGRKECGCVMALVTDGRNKSTGEAVSEFIKEGLTVDRVEWSVYTDKITLEENFMKCPHGQLALPI